MSILLLYIVLFQPLFAFGNSDNPTPQNQQQAIHSPTGQPSSSPAISEEPRELSMFFKIGIGLNIVMLTLYILWAVRQWRQSDKHED